MQKRDRLFLWLSLIANGACFFLILIPVLLLAFDGTKDYGGYGIYILVYYTVDSNLLTAAASLAVAFACIVRFRKPERPCSRALGIFKLSAAASVGLTFMTIMVWLGPPAGYEGSFSDVNLYLHLIAPILAVLSYIFLDSYEPLPFRTVLFAILPTALYGAVYLTNVVYTRHWKDFYHLYAGGKWYISAVIMLAASFSIGVFLWGMHRLFSSLLLRRSRHS